MFVTKLKVGAALALVCGILAAGAGFAVQRVLEEKVPAAVQGGGPKPAAKQADTQKPDARKLARSDDYGDPLPAGAVARLGTVRFRHEGEASSLVFSPDGKILAARCQNGDILLWEARTGKALQRSRRDSAGVTLDRVIDFSPDGRLLAVPSDSTHIGFWEVATGKLQREVALPESPEIHTVRFSPDGKFLAVGGARISHVLEVAAGKPLRHFQEKIGGLAFSPDGTSLIMQVIPEPFMDESLTRSDLLVRSVRRGRKPGWPR